MDPVASLNQLRKRFGGIEALKGISLVIPAGITYGLIGPNGSGKTTLMRILVGISRPTAGAAQVLGRAMPDRQVAQSIGYMTQAEALYQDLTVEENLGFFARVYGLSSAARSRRLDEVLELVDLVPRRKSLVAELSGGLRRRASLACALVHQPKLLILDEPTVGVDPELRIQFWNYFARLTAAGASIIVSTHHLDEASRCDRLGLLREGELLIEGTPDELREKAGASSLEDSFLYFARRRSAS
jgi:ABC-2 type transport system ATP-binding protein